MMFNKDWTLFLDRDGVINRKLEGDYVRNVNMIEWIPGSIAAICDLGKIFGRIIVVTNQRGVARGLMTEQDLIVVNSYMLDAIGKAGGRIDAIYYCTHNLEDHCKCRKPGKGMPKQAQRDFGDIDFEKSVMAGDSRTDLEMANSLNMVSVLIGPDASDKAGMYQHRFDTLDEMAAAWVRVRS